MWEFIVKGGPVMIPIILGSIFGLAIILEKFWFLRQLKLDTRAFTNEVTALVKAGKIPQAIALCEQNIAYPVAAVFKVGLERKQLSIERLEKNMEQEGNSQINKLEKRLGALASIVGIEPLLGFLGTITGLIRAFMSWEQAGANITVNILAQGIYEAMITTAAGLMVSIPCYLCYNYFISKIKYFSAEMTEYSMELAEVIMDNRGAK